MSGSVERKLTTILAADVAGYSRLMQADETLAFDALRRGRATFARLIERHRGRIANTAGDGLIAEFPSVVEAVRCAVDAQHELGDLAGGDGTPMRFRIGVHLDDVIVDGSDLLGDGVNIAARLQQMAEPGGILISRQVHDHVARKLRLSFESLGSRHLKNLTGEVEVFGVERVGGAIEGVTTPASAAPGEPRSADAPAAVQATGRRLGARRLMAVALVLVAIDAMTDGGPWAQFPLIALATLALMRSTTSWAPPWLGHGAAAAGAVLAGLLALNIATWNGDLWVRWPAAAYALWLLLRQVLTPRRG